MTDRRGAGDATLIASTSGASISTRVSLTSTAVCSELSPAPDAAATTWPTSCTLAPTQEPNIAGSSSCSGPRSIGSTTMARVPHRVTRAMATATSSSSALVTSSIAAMADAPQIE